MNEAIIQAAIAYAEQFFSRDAGGHDAHHTLRVYRTAMRLCREEGADPVVTALAALLHDVDDRKISPETTKTLGNARAFLVREGADDETAARVLEAVSTVSWSGGRKPSTLEGCIVQDADRLDAMGAIGIARTFAFGGSHGRAMYDPEGRDPNTSIAHFGEKLLLLRDHMNTPSARRLARERHRRMEQFLQDFHREWNGE